MFPFILADGWISPIESSKPPSKANSPSDLSSSRSIYCLLFLYEFSKSMKSELESNSPPRL